MKAENEHVIGGRGLVENRLMSTLAKKDTKGWAVKSENPKFSNLSDWAFF